MHPNVNQSNYESTKLLMQKAEKNSSHKPRPTQQEDRDDACYSIWLHEPMESKQQWIDNFNHWPETGLSLHSEDCSNILLNMSENNKTGLSIT